MEARPQTRVRRSYIDFEPSTELVQEEGSDTLLLKLTGFTKEQLKVQLDGSGTLKITGERPIGDNKWSRFEKDYKVSSNCDTSSIRATFEVGILFVIMPKIINIQADKVQDKVVPVPKAPSSSTRKGEIDSKLASPAKPVPTSQQLETLLNQNVRKDKGHGEALNQNVRKDKGHGEASSRTTSPTNTDKREKDETSLKFCTMEDGWAGNMFKRGEVILLKFKTKLGEIIGNDSNVNVAVGIFLVVAAVGISVPYLYKST